VKELFGSSKSRSADKKASTRGKEKADRKVICDMLRSAGAVSDRGRSEVPSDFMWLFVPSSASAAASTAPSPDLTAQEQTLRSLFGRLANQPLVKQSEAASEEPSEESEDEAAEGASAEELGAECDDGGSDDEATGNEGADDGTGPVSSDEDG